MSFMNTKIELRRKNDEFLQFKNIMELLKLENGNISIIPK